MLGIKKSTENQIVTFFLDAIFTHVLYLFQVNLNMETIFRSESMPFLVYFTELAKLFCYK